MFAIFANQIDFAKADNLGNIFSLKKSKILTWYKFSQKSCVISLNAQR